MRIPELVPPVSGLLCFSIGATEMLCRVIAAGRRDDLFDHREMRRMRFVKPGDHRVHRTQRPFGANHETGPAFAC